MTEKQFTETVSTGIVTDNVTGKEYKCDMRIDDDLLEVLNELYEENQQYKALLQNIGLLMSDEDVMCIRTEIADKFIKPICKENGFDVDVDCTNGFTIIPKGDLE